MAEAPSHVQRLRKAADEMRRENQNGWPLTCDAAADEIESLQSQIAELRAERDAAQEDARVYKETADGNSEIISRLAAENARLRALPLKDEVERVMKLLSCLDLDHSTEHDDLILETCVNDACSLLPRLRAGEQEGWRLVPEEPTEEMIEARFRVLGQGGKAEWDAMLAAAPSEQGGDRG